MNDTEKTSVPSQRSPWAKLLLAVLVVGVIGYLWVGEGLSFENIARHDAGLRAYQQAHPWSVYSVAFIIYVAATGIALPGASVLTLASGWLFGFLPGLLLVSFASTSGASLAFLLSRHVFGPVVQFRYRDKLQMFDDALARDGALYLFTLRLIPAIPYTGINVAMGLTSIKLRTFWWVSQLGMLPATVVYVSAGVAAPDLHALGEGSVTQLLSPQVLGALALVGLFPLVVRLVRKRRLILTARGLGETTDRF